MAANPSFISRLIDKKIDVVYNFISIGYLLEKKDLEGVEGSAATKKSILKLFHSILTKKTTFVVSREAMTSFYTAGKAIVPLIGTVDITPNKRTQYLRRLDSYLNKKSPSKFQIVYNSEFPKIAALCSGGLSLLYTVDSTFRHEKIHVFETDIINTLLHNATISQNMKTLDFSLELWNDYMNEVAGEGF